MPVPVQRYFSTMEARQASHTFLPVLIASGHASHLFIETPYASFRHQTRCHLSCSRSPQCDPEAVAIFELSSSTMKLGLVLFWALWFGLVLLNNVLEGLRALRVVPPYWKFASNNLQVIREVAGRYQAPRWLPDALFV